MANTAYIKITRKGKSPVDFMKDVDDKIHVEFQQRLAELGELCAEKMKEVIKSSIKRKGEGTLENSIDSKILDSRGGIHIGIGTISELPIYWEVLNNGGYVPPANKGYFGDGNPPIKGGAGEVWTHTGKDFFMTPKKAIEPMRYIEVSSDELKLNIEKEIDRLYLEMGK